MKKKEINSILLVTILFILIFVQVVSAINLKVSNKPISNSFIPELNKPAIFQLEIKNLEETDNFEIYSLIGVNIFTDPLINIESGKSKEIKIEVIPQEAIKTNKGFFTFEYTLRNSKGEVQKESLTINIINLEDIFSITAETINPQSDTVTISIKNKLDLEFKDLKIKIKSAFLDYDNIITLTNYETKIIEIPLNKEKLKILNAGQYIIENNLEYQNKKINKESIIKFTEKGDIETKENQEGILRIRREITKTNIGNIKEIAEITIEKNIIECMFTTINIPTTKSEIQGFKKIYTWEKELIPNQELKIIITTNWYFPIIILILIILIVYYIRRSIETDLSLRKKVSFVKTKGGQFALKITLRIKAKRFIEKISIVDKIPYLVKLYDRFGVISPDKIDLNNKRLEYNLESLNKDEERIFTYIIYSKIGVIGKFELPEAKVTYEKEGKIKHATSNRSFFINEPKR